MKIYFPDSFPAGRQCDRKYMFDVFNTKYPEKCQAIIDHAHSQRYSVVDETKKEECIQISEKW